MHKSSKRIYLDHAATTPINPRVLEAMMPYLQDNFGNPGSIHSEGVSAKQAIIEAHEKIAKIISSRKDEVVFTSGATEANNYAILGVVRKAMESMEKVHIITSAFEHKSALTPAKVLEVEGVEVTYLKPNSDGIVEAKDVREAIKDNTVLVSVMMANNEIGTKQPIKEISRVVKLSRGDGHYPVMFTDAAGAVGSVPINVESLGVDLLSVSAQKIYGPKGAGFLYIRRGTPIKQLMFGGGQEESRRPGTENVPAIVGMTEALTIVEEKREEEVARQLTIRDWFIDSVLGEIDGAKLNGSREERLCGNISLSLPHVEGEQMVIELDQRGIAVSTGSACERGAEPSLHVTMSIGLTHEEALNTVRIGMGRSTTKEDMEYLKESIKEVINKYHGGN